MAETSASGRLFAAIARAVLLSIQHYEYPTVRLLRFYGYPSEVSDGLCSYDGVQLGQFTTDFDAGWYGSTFLEPQ